MASRRQRRATFEDFADALDAAGITTDEQLEELLLRCEGKSFNVRGVLTTLQQVGRNNNGQIIWQFVRVQ